ncbi:hypothetical protein ASE04_22975 [Rhizobium sp. Root708]|nr:hypothetical protein ASE04_22975 [Rhizobium sp. Root708]
MFPAVIQGRKRFGDGSDRLRVEICWRTAEVGRHAGDAEHYQYAHDKEALSKGEPLCAHMVGIVMFAGAACVIVI